MLLEGDRLIEDAVRARIVLDDVFVDESRDERARTWREAGLPVRTVAPALIAKASSLVTPPGAVAIAARPPRRELAELSLDEHALILVACGVGDPGNLGALARSAEAAGATALVALEGCANPWNAKSLRGSMGSLLRLPVVDRADAARVSEELARAGFRQVRAETRGGADYTELAAPGPLALWVASETGELPAVASAHEAVTIPMRGEAESLNVAAAASILLYAAGRWRERK